MNWRIYLLITSIISAIVAIVLSCAPPPSNQPSQIAQPDINAPSTSSSSQPPIDDQDEYDDEEDDDDSRSSDRFRSSSRYSNSSNSRYSSSSRRYGSSSSSRPRINISKENCTSDFGDELCIDDQDCETLCYSKAFGFNTAKKRKCLEAPQQLVEFYHTIITDLEGDNVGFIIDEDAGAHSFRCLVKFDEELVVDKIRRLDEDASIEILQAMVDDSDFSETIIDLDNEALDEILENSERGGIKDFVEEGLEGWLRDLIDLDKDKDFWSKVASFIARENGDDSVLKTICEGAPKENIGTNGYRIQAGIAREFERSSFSTFNTFAEPENYDDTNSGTHGGTCKNCREKDDCPRCQLNSEN